jgi:hypothetical protein
MRKRKPATKTPDSPLRLPADARPHLLYLAKHFEKKGRPLSHGRIAEIALQKLADAIRKGDVTVPASVPIVGEIS